MRVGIQKHRFSFIRDDPWVVYFLPDGEMRAATKPVFLKFQKDAEYNLRVVFECDSEAEADRFIGSVVDM